MIGSAGRARKLEGARLAPKARPVSPIVNGQTGLGWHHVAAQPHESHENLVHIANPGIKVMVRGYPRVQRSLILLLFLLPGCASIAKQVTTDQVARIEIGKSTREDVLQVLGLPNARELRGVEGGGKLEFWTYYRTPGRSTILLCGYVGCTPLFSLEENKDPAAIVVFNESGLVVDVQ